MAAKSQPETTEEKLEIIQPDGIDTLEIVPFGTDQRIKLSIKIVRNLIAVPTKTGKTPSDSDCIRFMMLCKAKHLNPFEGDAFFLGYDTQNGPTFSQITAHQVFLKRAEASKGFKGMQSGVIVQRNPVGSSEWDIEEREGDLVYPGEKLIGGWAKVYRKELEFPFYKRLKLETFSTGRSRWEKDAAGMIVKCAEADALRTAFPTHLGGLYIEEEIPPIDITPQIKRAKIEEPKALGGGKTEPDSSEAADGQRGSDTQTETPTAEPKKKLARKKKAAAVTEPPPVDSNTGAHAALLAQMLDRLAIGKFTTDQLIRVGHENDWIGPNADPPGENTEGWPLSEQRLSKLMHEDNWPVVQEALEDL